MAAASDGTAVNNSGTSFTTQYSDQGTDCNIQRAAVLFDTSALPDTDVVSAAVLSISGLFKGNTNSYSMRLVASTPASTTALVTGDFDQFGTTSLANEITLSSFSTSGFNDFTLTDLTTVNRTGVSKYGFRLTGDISGASPTGANYAQASAVDTSGTTVDPVLVVTHAAPEPECGDSVIEGDEECDDGDVSSGDGCSSLCVIESGWSCTGEPSVCTEDAPPSGSGSDLFGTGSLIITSSVCDTFDEFESGSGSTFECSEWTTTIRVDALRFLARTQFFASIWASVLIVVLGTLILWLVKILSWFWSLFTKAK